MKKSFARPDWIPQEVWEGFEDMRQKIRAPLTDRARSLTVRELLRLREQGYDPVEVLDQSTQRGWRGVFPIKQETRAWDQAASARLGMWRPQ